MRFLSLIVLVLLAGCADNSQFTQASTTEFFTQDFNPQNLDVLWVIDNRSPMYRAKDHILSEATRFFQRLDSVTSNYQMAFISMDMDFSKGKLKPDDNGLILKKNVGTVSERTSAFSNLISQIINLKTSADNHGFESTVTSLNQYFPLRTGIPLVVIYMSDGDDHSPLPTEVTDATSYYLSTFLKIKDNRSELLRIYSINYLSQTPSDANRCATRYNADVDSVGFENRFFNIANQNNRTLPVTADLCSSFADLIDLTGLRLKVSQQTFPLAKKPNEASLIVAVSKDKNSIEMKWVYNSTNQSIDFTEAPPEGSTVQVTYRPE